MWNLIVSVPDHCLSFYSVYMTLLSECFISLCEKFAKSCRFLLTGSGRWPIDIF